MYELLWDTNEKQLFSVNYQTVPGQKIRIFYVLDRKIMDTIIKYAKHIYNRSLQKKRFRSYQNCSGWLALLPRVVQINMWHIYSQACDQYNFDLVGDNDYQEKTRSYNARGVVLYGHGTSLWTQSCRPMDVITEVSDRDQFHQTRGVC